MGKSTGPGTQGCEDFSSIFEGPSAGFSLGAGEVATLLCWPPGKTCAPEESPQAISPLHKLALPTGAPGQPAPGPKSPPAAQGKCKLYPDLRTSAGWWAIPSVLRKGPLRSRAGAGSP